MLLNSCLTSLFLYLNQARGPFYSNIYNGGTSLKLDGCMFSKQLFSLVRVPFFKSLFIKDCMFRSFLDNCITVNDNTGGIVRAQSQVQNTYCIIDTTFCDFLPLSFNYTLFVNESNAFLYVTRSRLFNMSANRNSPNSLIQLFNGRNATYTHVCSYNHPYVRASLGVNSHTNNIPYGLINQTYEFNIDHLCSSWIGGRESTSFYYNNITNTRSISYRSGICVLYTHNGDIGGYSIINQNQGSSMIQLSMNFASSIIRKVQFISNNCTNSLFEFTITKGHCTFIECNFMNSSITVPFISGETSTISSIALEKCSYDLFPGTVQAQVTSFDCIQVVTMISDVYFPINSRFCWSQENTICNTIMRESSHFRTIYLMFMFVLN